MGRMETPCTSILVALETQLAAVTSLQMYLGKIQLHGAAMSPEAGIRREALSAVARALKLSASGWSQK